MTAAVAPGFSVDVKSRPLPIRIGQSISNPSRSERWKSVRYNYKPETKQAENAKCAMKAADGDRNWKLFLKDDGNSYTYSGSEETEAATFVLICQGRDDSREMILERAESRFSFNLTKSSIDRTGSKLADQYPSISTHGGGYAVTDSSGDDDVDQPPDDSNPFDYRHFLKEELAKPSTTNPNLDGSRNGTATPGSATPVFQPQSASRSVNPTETKISAVTKRKAAVAEKPNPKRVKAGTEEPLGDDRPKAKSNAIEVPKLRLDRRASTRQASLDVSGELILENETPIEDKRTKSGRAMKLGLSGVFGPISLHSAMSSPASRISSPLPPRPEGADEEYEFDLGGDSPKADQEQESTRMTKSKDLADTNGLEEGDDGDDNDDDDDNNNVDNDDDKDAPRHPQRSQANAMSTTVASGDDDDDLDKQLALAMAEDDEAGNPASGGHADSDEESEEE